MALAVGGNDLQNKENLIMSEGDRFGSTGSGMPLITGNSGVGYVAGSNPGQRVNVQPQREVDSAMEELNNQIERLAQSLGELRERLQLVLSPEPPQAQSAEPIAGNYPSKYSCALSSSIAIKADYVRENRERVERILAHLQL